MLSRRPKKCWKNAAQLLTEERGKNWESLQKSWREKKGKRNYVKVLMGGLRYTSEFTHKKQTLMPMQTEKWNEILNLHWITPQTLNSPIEDHMTKSKIECCAACSQYKLHVKDSTEKFSASRRSAISTILYKILTNYRSVWFPAALRRSPH